MVKNLPAVQEIWVRSLSQKDPLDKKTAVHPRILAWRIPWITGQQDWGGGHFSTACPTRTVRSIYENV